MKNLVTVVVPVYNTEEYLEECLFSISNQTLKQIQVIIVNDCSPDNSISVAEKYAAEDPRFQVITHNVNKGVGAARNTGIEYAESDYITFLDSDDSYPRDALARMFEAITTSNSDTVIGRMVQKKKDGELVPIEYIEQKIKKFLRHPTNNVRIVSSQEFYCGSATHQMFRASLFKDNKIKFLEGVYHEDIPATFETWFYATSIKVIPYIIHYRTVRENLNNLSATQTFNFKAFNDRLLIIEYIYNFCLMHARSENDLIDLTLEILVRINATTNDMLKSVSKEEKELITKAWYPNYQDKYSQILEDIQLLKREILSSDIERKLLYV